MKSGGGVGLGVVFLPEQRRDDHISQEEACHKREGNKTSRFPIKILHFNKRFKCRGLPNAIITKVGRKSEVLFYRLFTFGTFSLPIGKNKTQFFLGFLPDRYSIKIVGRYYTKPAKTGRRGLFWQAKTTELFSIPLTVLQKPQSPLFSGGNSFWKTLENCLEGMIWK